MKKITAFIITFLALQFIYAQQVEFTAEVSKNQLGANERLRIEFTMNRNGDNFTPPNFQGFTVVMGPSQSISNSWINGVRTFSQSYIYILQPTSKGKHTIGAATVDIEGRTYRTKPIEITVTGEVQNPSIDKNSNDIARESFFLLAEVSKPNPYLNEAVTVIYKLYVGNQIALNSLEWLTTPKYPNFWSQDLKMQQYEIGDCNYQGKPYRCITVKKIVLYPQKTGVLTLEPLTMDAVLSVPTGQRDFFGRPYYEEVSRRVTSGNRTLNVKELPQEGKPDSFGGAVGDFSFNVTTNKLTLKANESLQLKVEVSGSGNLKLFDLPKPIFPSSLEVYAPEQKDDISTTLQGMNGRVEHTYTIVPEYKGKYPVSGLTFSYFNPVTQKYVTVKTDDLLIDVTEGPAADSNTTANSDTSATQTDNSFAPAQTNAQLQPIGKHSFFGSVGYYLWSLLPLLIIPIVLLWWRAQQRRAGDIEGNKVRVANRLAKKYLGEAKRKLGDKATFYEALERALHNYLKAKLKIETAEMSKDTISELLLQRQADETTVSQFIKLLANCEMARYAQHSEAAMERDFEDAVEVISGLDKQMKSK
ncbi:BatD family protein [Capnocytophaga bilenii]|uniref:BatD family protein n=1 Tax=Capnocytophaga bilenii TaxID=2819369 RepID=UPI0028D073C3|nr:BatD family protein [Capnocytophaga bilenii]